MDSGPMVITSWVMNFLWILIFAENFLQIFSAASAKIPQQIFLLIKRMFQEFLCGSGGEKFEGSFLQKNPQIIPHQIDFPAKLLEKIALKFVGTSYAENFHGKLEK